MQDIDAMMTRLRHGLWASVLAGSALVACSDSSDTDSGPGSGMELEQARSTKARLPGTASSSSVHQLTHDNADFAFELLRAADPADDENFFFSPHSISIALAMTYSGAEGQTKDEMKAALHFTQSDSELHGAFNSLDQALATRGQGAEGADGEPFRLKVANAAWAQRDYTFLPAYLDTLAESYGAGINLLDFIGDAEGGRTTINAWVSEQTEERIDELLQPGTVTPNTRLVLTNAVYFNASWDEPFEESATRDGTFTRLDGSSTSAQMMRQGALHRYAEGAGFQAVELDYDGEEVSMLVVMPDEGAFERVQGDLSAATVESIVASLQDREVSLTFPKFEFRTQVGLAQTLSDLGMPTAFTDGADFSGMNGTGGLVIQDVIHEAFVKVNEAGTEAAAATAVVVGTTSAPEYVEMNVDRPFLFFIRDDATGAVVFVGRVMDPTS